MNRPLTPDELQAFYMLIGRCLWDIQYLEDVLQKYLTLKVDVRTRGSVSVEEGFALLSKQRSHTLTTLLKKAAKNSAMDGASIQRLEAVRNERDWLVHRMQHELSEAAALYTDDGRAKVFARLQKLVHDVEVVKHDVAQHMNDFVSGQGVDIAKATALGEALHRRRQGK